MVQFNLTKMRFLFVLRDNILLFVLCFLVIVKNHATHGGGENTSVQTTSSQDQGLEASGSDKGMYNTGLLQGDIYRRTHRMRNAICDESQIWPHAAIVYQVDDNVGCPDSPQCRILMRAFEHYHTRSCVRFKEWSGEPHRVKIFLNPESGACWSSVGRTSEREQMVSLGQRCWYLGIVIHELGHTIGFWHEMNRPDRDSFISISWKNILPGFVGAFQKHDTRSVNTLDESFDTSSIMMYDEYAFSKDGVSPTITTKDRSIIGPIWRKAGLSASDQRRLHKLYNCQGANQKAGFPYDVTCHFDEDTCGFKNGRDVTWSWKRVNQTEGYVYTAASENATTGYFMSVNFHGAEKDGRNIGPVGCVRFWYLIKGDGEMYLKLRQSYLTSSTQLLYVEADTFDLWENDNKTMRWMNVKLQMYVIKPFKLIFESNFRNSTSGLIALDNLEVMYSPCLSDETEQPLNTTQVPITEYTQTETQSTLSVTEVSDNRQSYKQ